MTNPISNALSELIAAEVGKHLQALTTPVQPTNADELCEVADALDRLSNQLRVMAAGGRLENKQDKRIARLRADYPDRIPTLGEVKATLKLTSQSTAVRLRRRLMDERTATAKEAKS